jgi:hypothetical protein
VTGDHYPTVQGTMSMFTVASDNKYTVQGSGDNANQCSLIRHDMKAPLYNLPGKLKREMLQK